MAMMEIIAVTVHPRVRGEQVFQPIDDEADGGSSPRARGAGVTD